MSHDKREREIRRVEPGDAERVRDLHEVALRDAGAFVEGGPDADLRDPLTAYVEAGGEFLVAAYHGRIVGMGAIRPVADRTAGAFADLRTPAAELKRMRVAPDHQRSGVGSALLDRLETAAREREFRELVLDTSLDQDGARAFYEARGFAHERDVTVSVDAGTFGLALYRKPLD
ncbi:MAG: GNAT family N-acetyltransferase [Haloarculaceae archaeon]